jgi:hypothetical protein
MRLSAAALVMPWQRPDSLHVLVFFSGTEMDKWFGCTTEAVPWKFEALERCFR